MTFYQTEINDKPVCDVAREAASFAAQRGRCLYGTNRAADRQTDTATDTA